VFADRVAPVSTPPWPPDVASPRSGESDRAASFGGPTGSHPVVPAPALADAPDRYAPAPAYRYDELPRRPDPRPNRLLPAAVGVAVVAVVAAGWFLLHDSGSHHTATGTTSTPVATVTVTDAGGGGAGGTDTGGTDTGGTQPPGGGPADTAVEQDQLSAVEDILNASVNSRAKLHQALQSTCNDPAGALALMNDVATERSAEISSASGLDLSAVPNGDELRRDLVTMLQASANADSAYRGYVRDVYNGSCKSGHAAFVRGNNLSGAAQAAKTVFFGVWRPLALEFGLTPHDNTDV
jgi:hypothetical protein